MVRVSGAVRLVTGRVSDVVSVGVRAREVRTDGRDVVVDFSDTVKITGGQLSFECLPGPAVLVVAEAASSQVAVPLLVPSRDASLAECIDAAKQADGESLASLEQLVFEVRDASAGVRADADRAARSATQTGQSESRAKTAETNAKTSESNAATSARNAKTSETNAAEHAAKAAQSEIAAGTSAESAKRDAERVATIAGSTRWVGTKVEVNGKLSPNLMPDLSISERGTWVINGVDTGQPARGADGKMTFEELTPAQRESLKGGKGDKGDKGEPGTTSWAGITDKPVKFTPATHSHKLSEMEGFDSLMQAILDVDKNLQDVFAPAVHTHTSDAITDASNDLGKGKGGKVLRGRASDGKIFTYTPTSEVTDSRELVAKGWVDEQLAGKANATHKHTLTDITNAPNSHTSLNTGSTLMSRDNFGRARVNDPSNALDIANKRYVDAVDAKVDLRPALFSGWGPPPASIPGATVGCYWLDKSTMELHEITSL